MPVQPSNAHVPAPDPTGSPAAPLAPEAVRPPLFTPEELAAFKARVSPLIGLDLHAYKPRQMERRVAALMSRANVPSLEALYAQLANDPARLGAFVNGLMINVTEFFRNPEKFEELAAHVLPDLLSRFDRIKVWSAGCSVGAELYTVGIVLERMGALDRAELVGTDLDQEAIEKARQGLYTPHEVQALPPETLEAYFRTDGNRHRFTGEAIMAKTRFECQNLLTAPPERDCHLVLCRNVVIYLNDESKRVLYQAFREALVPGGVLFVGNTERIFDCRDLGLKQVAPFFYQKPL